MNRILLIDCDSLRVPSLEGQLCQLGYLVRREKLFALPKMEEISAYPLVVISGGPHLLTNPLEASRLNRAFDFLKDYQGAVFGICLGHQALGLASDAAIYRGEARRNHENMDWLLPKHPCMAELPSGTQFVTDHCEGITKPSDYIIVGRSNAYPVEMMVHNNLPRVGVQFHPESSGENGFKLMKAALEFLKSRSR